MNQSNDSEEDCVSRRIYTDTNNNLEPSISHNEKQLEPESGVTKHIKDSIARSNQNITGKSIEEAVRQLTDMTSNLVNEMPKVVARTVQIANKMVSVGKEGVNSINHIRNSVSLDKNK